MGSGAPYSFKGGASAAMHAVGEKGGATARMPTHPPLPFACVQVKKCADAGADIVRITVQGKKEADACKLIRKRLDEDGWVGARPSPAREALGDGAAVHRQRSKHGAGGAPHCSGAGLPPSAHPPCPIEPPPQPQLVSNPCLETTVSNLCFSKNSSRAACARSYDVPLVADIHFQPAIAMAVAECLEKIRINPGNFADGRKTFEVINYDDPKQFEEEKAYIEEVRRGAPPGVEGVGAWTRGVCVGF